MLAILDAEHATKLTGVLHWSNIRVWLPATVLDTSKEMDGTIGLAQTYHSIKRLVIQLYVTGNVDQCALVTHAITGGR